MLIVAEIISRSIRGKDWNPKETFQLEEKSRAGVGQRGLPWREL